MNTACVWCLAAPRQKNRLCGACYDFIADVWPEYNPRQLLLALLPDTMRWHAAREYKRREAEKLFAMLTRLGFVLSLPSGRLEIYPPLTESLESVVSDYRGELQSIAEGVSDGV